MDQQLKLAEDEAQEYQAFLQKLENESEEDNRVLELEAELEKIQMEEASLQKELQVSLVISICDLRFSDFYQGVVLLFFFTIQIPTYDLTLFLKLCQLTL